MNGPSNIILLTVDALRADHCSGLSYERETTPNLDAFAKEAIEFHECVSVSSHTREAMPPLLSGYRPTRFAANGFRATDDPLLAERLADGGYATGGFHSNPYISRAYGFDRGFEEFYDDLLLGRNRFFALAQRALEKFVFKRGEYYARADEINRRSLDWLDTVGDDQPVFLWNHYMDVHGPYHAPERHWAEKSLTAGEAESLYRRAWKDPDGITDREQHLLVDSYDDEIRWLDGQLKSFFDELRDRGLFEDSLVIVTADHGDAFGEHGYFTHPRYLHDTLLRVPLVVSPPSGATTTVDEQVSTLDVVPTVTSHAGLDINLPGTPLITPDRILSDGHEMVFASASGENEESHLRRYLVRTREGRCLCEWNQETESIDFVDCTNPSLRDELESYIEEQAMRESREGVFVEDDQELDEEIERRLSALGYKE